MMADFTVIADYQRSPSEGIQVVSKTLIDGLRAAGHAVTVIEPPKLMRLIPSLILRRPPLIVFTHGPGKGGVMASLVLRRFTRARIIWVATRPDLATCPRWLKNKPTAQTIICNRTRLDLQSVASGARFVNQFIGIDPARLKIDLLDPEPWPELRATGRPVALHVGHLRRNRGLDLLVEAKRALGDRIEIVVQGSPTFPPAPGLVAELTQAGIHVRHSFVANLATLYRASDLYLFPVRDEQAGAIELPLSVLEAVSCGRPVLSTDYGALRDALGDVPGIHFTLPDGFSSALESLLNERQSLMLRPDGLPNHLHAARITEAVVRAAELA